MTTQAFPIREDICCICRKKIRSHTTTNDDPETPEMILLPPGVWFGVVMETPGDAPMLNFCCSAACLNDLMREGA